MNHPKCNDLIHEEDVTFSDIVLGPGGHALHRPFHQRYLDMKDLLRQFNRRATSNAEKRAIQQMLVDFVYTHNGRFIRRVNACYFTQVSMKEAY
jgi:hypothetical protein